MRLGFVASSSLHVLVILIAWFGLPHIRRAPPKLDSLIFVKIADIGDVTNVPTEFKPPKTKIKEKVKKLKTSKTIAQKKQSTSRPLPTPIPELNPKTRLKPDKKSSKKAVKTKDLKVKIPSKPKPRPVVSSKRKPRITPKPPKRPVKKQFTSLLKNLKREKNIPRAPKEQKTLRDRLRQAAATRGNQAYDPSRKVTISEIELVRQQISQCWNIAAGARQADALSVEIEIKMNPDATVRAARVVDAARMNSDPFFRAAAESALRALNQPDCIPLKLPVGKYELWKSFTFNFDPKNMIQ